MLGVDGRAGEIWLQVACAYRFDVKDSLGNLIKTYDNLVGENSIPFVSVSNFGTTGDGSTDDTTAIVAAIAALAAQVSGVGLSTTYRPILWFPPALGYKTTSNIAVPQNINILMDGPIFYAGAGGEVAMTIGVDSATDVTRDGNYVLDVRRSTQSTWLSETDIGIKFIGVCSSDIWLRRADKFTIGVQFQSTANFGCFFNRVRIGEIRENKVGIDIASSNVSWANNNNQFYGGEYACTSGSPAGISRYGVRYSGTSEHNANTFYSPSFELSLSQATSGNPSGVAVPFLVVTGGPNFHYNVRSEGNSATLAVISDTAAKENYFQPAYDFRNTTGPSFRTNTLSDSSYAQTTVFNDSMRLLKQGANLVFDSGNLGRVTNIYDGSTTYTIDGFDIGLSDFTMFMAQTSISGGHDRFVGFTAGARNLVRWIDTEFNKRFIVQFETETGSTNFAYGIVPYDATQTILADNPTPPHVFGEDANQLGWNAAEYTTVGAYVATGSALYTYVYFAVDSLTKIVAFVLESNNGLKLRRIRIYAIDYECSTWQVLRAPGMSGKKLASAVPAVDSWIQGERIWRDNATSGGTDGWACTTKGTFGALAAITATTTLNSIQVTVNSAANIETGMYITIAGVSGIKRVIGVSGTTVVIDVKADAAVSGAAVAYSTPVFKLMANLS